MNKIALPTNDGFRMVAIGDIIRCEADNNYTMIVLAHGQSILISRQLKAVEEILTPHGFLRVHYSHVVNLNYVDYYVRNGGGKLYLTNGDVVEVSRARKQSLMDKINLV